MEEGESGYYAALTSCNKTLETTIPHSGKSVETICQDEQQKQQMYKEQNNNKNPSHPKNTRHMNNLITAFRPNVNDISVTILNKEKHPGSIFSLLSHPVPFTPATSISYVQLLHLQSGQRHERTVMLRGLWLLRGHKIGDVSSNVFIALFPCFPSFQAVQVVLVDQLLNVALHERVVHVEQVLQL